MPRGQNRQALTPARANYSNSQQPPLTVVDTTAEDMRHDSEQSGPKKCGHSVRGCCREIHRYTLICTRSCRTRSSYRAVQINVYCICRRSLQRPWPSNCEETKGLSKPRPDESHETSEASIARTIASTLYYIEGSCYFAPTLGRNHTTNNMNCVFRTTGALRRPLRRQSYRAPGPDLTHEEKKRQI